MLPQTVLAECLKGNEVENMRRSLRGIATFSSQISVLKSGKALLNMRPRGTGLQSRFIDYRLTKGLRRNLMFNLAQTGIAALEVDGMIRSAKPGADAAHAAYLEFSKRARDGMLCDHGSLSNDEIRALRQGALVPSLLEKLQRRALATTAKLFKDQGCDLQSIPVSDAVYSLQFRYAVATDSLMMEWCVSAGLNTRSDKNIANDLIDLSQVALGTYFDGVLACDVRLLRVAKLARVLVAELIKLHKN